MLDSSEFSSESDSVEVPSLLSLSSALPVVSGVTVRELFVSVSRIADARGAAKSTPVRERIVTKKIISRFFMADVIIAHISVLVKSDCGVFGLML